MKKFLGYGFSILIGAGAMLFEMSESITFWNLAFSQKDWFMAYLGFFMTSIAMLGYFYDFLYKAKGRTQKTVALVMAIVCALGSIATAAFGFKISAFDKYHFAFNESDIQLMSILVMVLVAAHLIALFIYYGGDAIANAWKDDDKDGIPNFLDAHNTLPVSQPTALLAPPPAILSAPTLESTRQYQSEIDMLRAELDEMKKANPTKAATQ